MHLLARISPLAVLALAMAFWGAPGGWTVAHAGTTIDADKIYYGDVRKYSHPVTVDAAKVYKQIPAHREIADRKLTRDDPDYWPLLRKASQAFVKALRKVCQAKGYDLVAEAGTMRIDGQSVPEITADVIAALEGKPEGKAAPKKPEK